MLYRHRHLLCRVTAHNYKSRITAATRAAIAGLDDGVFGFSRAECCGPVPAKLPGSFAVTDHVFVKTAIPPTEWAKRTQNVPEYTALKERLEVALPSASLTVCHTLDYAANTVFRFHFDSTNSSESKCRCCATTGASAAALPWDGAAAEAADCSSHFFVFICAHRLRDARCGYCGPVLVDLVSQEMQRAFPGKDSVHVVPCSHFGGHVYAGNVLVYSRHGGVCFGCFTPSDTEALINYIRRDDGAVPEELAARVRGRMTRPVNDASAA